VAQWLVTDGYSDVAVLAGGLPAWQEASLPVAPVEFAAQARMPWKPLPSEALAPGTPAVPDAPSVNDAFLPRLAGQNFLVGQALPLKRHMAVLFVDMVDSTPLLWRYSAEEVLGLVQAFMEVVVDVGVYHCGDVHDFQGDGALLYFEGPGEAVPAAFQLRDALLAKRRELPLLPLARLALDVGPLVIGIVGTRFRRSVSLVGPSINVAARILKLAPPGGIIATQAVVQHATRTDPDLAAQFVSLPEPQHLKGVEDGPVTLFVAAAPATGGPGS